MNFHMRNSLKASFFACRALTYLKYTISKLQEGHWYVKDQTVRMISAIELSRSRIVVYSVPIAARAFSITFLVSLSYCSI